MLKGNSAGRFEAGSTGTLTKIWANATGFKAKVGGITFDWSSVTPLVADLTLPDGTVLKAGQRALLYGTFVALINDNAADVDARGHYGLVDTTANDGRQTLQRGRVFFVDTTYLIEDDMSAHPAVFDAGTVFEARMKIQNVAAPGFLTRAQAQDLFPELRFVSTTR